MYKPTMSDLTFSGNTADYGPDLAGYPINIVLNTTSSTIKIVSGQSTDNTLIYITYDFFDQVALSLKNRLAGLEINSTEIQVTSQTRASSLNGMFSFSETIIIGYPGTSGYLTFLTSSLDLSKHNKYYSTSISEFTITTQFDIRYCARGEAQERQICVVCPQTTYTLVENSTKWLDCPDNAYCPGGDQIILDEGYWRASIDTDVIFAWLNQNGWLGGMYSEWKTGYYGRLWNECIFDDALKYSRTREYDWASWPPLLQNLIFSGTLCFLTCLYIAFLTYSNYMNAIKEKHSTVMLRIFTMYMQIYGIIASFDTMSSLIYEFVNFMSYGGEPAGKILTSFDCIFLRMGATRDVLYIIKLFVVSTLPILGGLLAFIFYFLLFLCTKKRDIFKKQYIVTLSVIYYLIYPTIVKFSVGLLN